MSGADASLIIRDPIAARAASEHLAQMQVLELGLVEIRRRETEIRRNEAMTHLLRGRWAGPIALGVLALIGILIVGIFAISGADLTVVVDLADRIVTIIRGCDPAAGRH